jgi:hypothetical protein
MKGQRWTRSVWFWIGTVLAVVTVAVFGYAFHLRQEVVQVHEDYLQQQRDVVAILQGIEDEASLTAAWPELLAHRDRGQDLAQRAALLPRPSAQLEQELAEKYGPEIKYLVKALNAQRERILQLPRGAEFWDKLETLKPSQTPSLIQQGTMP